MLHPSHCSQYSRRIRQVRQTWGEIGEPVQSQAAPGEDVTGVLGAGGNAAGKIP